MRYPSLAVAGALLALCGASLPAQQRDPVISAAASSYTLRPGDIIRIGVWGHEDLSGQFQVNEDGKIQYPLIGEIDLRDLTVAQVRDTIRAGLERLFTTPFVTITPLFRIAVLGEIRNPGLYTVDPTLSVLDVVALAGGPTSNGNMERIRLLRSGAETRVSFEDAAVRGRTLQEVGVRSGDEIVVPRRSFTRSDWQVVLQLVQVALTVAVFVNVVGN
jgi:polysaccharide export outer membrane protein